ncbi:hypothetical protein CC80DRAFT_251772 [Byssothecium circinans]|uniref:Uncharacterized protein n=1 Tax=Byssothecium circinans TaxID=147558 RepID=A0A6A5TLK8_9PLEO|nr:hypothetical protein CC80DRAFT_251772 [Byssothecium circinans]
MKPIQPSENVNQRNQKFIAAYDRAANRAKRPKLHHDSSPEPSNVSEDSALVPTSVPEESTDASDYDSDMSSEVSESSEEPSDESSEDSQEEDEDATPAEEAVVNLRANKGKKPVMKLAEEEKGDDIRQFLKDFLPKLKAANEELEAQRAAGTLQTSEITDEKDAEGQGDDEEQYIELNLGLGVLEAKDADASDASDSENGEEVGDGTAETDRLGKLMGREKAEAVTSIQVVDEAQGS